MNNQSEYHIRKQERKVAYEKQCAMLKRVCVSCNGSGRYDSFGSPKCGCCGGTGKEFYLPTPSKS